MQAEQDEFARHVAESAALPPVNSNESARLDRDCGLRHLRVAQPQIAARVESLFRELGLPFSGA